MTMMPRTAAAVWRIPPTEDEDNGHAREDDADEDADANATTANDNNDVPWPIYWKSPCVGRLATTFIMLRINRSISVLGAVLQLAC